MVSPENRCTTRDTLQITGVRHLPSAAFKCGWKNLTDTTVKNLGLVSHPNCTQAVKGLCIMGECTDYMWMCSVGLFIVKGCFTACWNENKEGRRWRRGTTWPLTKEPQCTSNKCASLCNASKKGVAFVTLRAWKLLTCLSHTCSYIKETVDMSLQTHAWSCQDFVCLYFDKLAWRSRRHYCNTDGVISSYLIRCYSQCYSACV